MSEFLLKPKKKPIDLKKAASLIAQHEGFRPSAYKDVYGKWTIGYGNLIGDGSDTAYKASPYYQKKINRDLGQKLLMGSVREKANLAASPKLLGDKLFDLSPELQSEVISSVYRGGLSGSPKTMEYIRGGKYKEAAKEFLDNDEYRAAVKAKTGVAGRMNKLAGLLNRESTNAPMLIKKIEDRRNAR